MTKQSIGLNNQLYDYFMSISLREPDILRRLREETATHELRIMQVAPEQGQFMALLVQLMGASKILEIGVFTGYSSLCLALALPPNGTLLACDINEEYTSVARRYWQEAGVADKISLKLAPALETLDQLLASPQAGTFDLVFIDADKENYEHYYERSLQLIRNGGLILIDNVLWDGQVANPEIQDITTQTIRDFNEKLRHDARVTLSLVPIGDGLTLALKRRWASILGEQ